MKPPGTHNTRCTYLHTPHCNAHHRAAFSVRSSREDSPWAGASTFPKAGKRALACGSVAPLPSSSLQDASLHYLSAPQSSQTLSLVAFKLSFATSWAEALRVSSLYSLHGDILTQWPSMLGQPWARRACRVSSSSLSLSPLAFVLPVRP